MSRTALFAAVAAGVLAIGLSPVSLPDLFRGQDKLNHVVGFAALVLTARVAFPRVAVGRLALWLLVVALAIEAVQGLWPRRNASWLDMAANVLGVLVGLGCYRIYRGWRRLRTTPPS
jgi:VanZ family protein